MENNERDWKSELFEGLGFYQALGISPKAIRMGLHPYSLMLKEYFGFGDSGVIVDCGPSFFIFGLPVKIDTDNPHCLDFHC